jgi:hypothetical protein
MLEGFCFAADKHTRKEQITKKEQTDKHTRKETTKMKKENMTGTKHKWKTCRV